MKVHFFPVGNGDSTLIQPNLRQNVLFDFVNSKTDNKDDKRVNLANELDLLVTNSYFDVVAFSHSDEDHIYGFADYFYLEHNVKYQGKDKKRINDLWVPAAVLLEKDEDITSEDGKLLKAEAKYRLKNKANIKVFSEPDSLSDWLERNDLKYDDVKHLIVNAGTLVPGWEKAKQGVEFFVHSPFAYKIEGTTVYRNDCCIVLQAIFGNTPETKLMLGADGGWELWEEIVDITLHYKKEQHLVWDIFHISHHCSYLSLSSEKGKEITTPTEKVKKLYETYGTEGCILVSPSKVIPTEDTDQPPHRQAANYYKKVATSKKGEFKVTMDFPTATAPKVMIIEIDNMGARIIKQSAPIVVPPTNKPPKAG